MLPDLSVLDPPLLQSKDEDTHHYKVSETSRVKYKIVIICLINPSAKAVRFRSGYISISMVVSGRARNSLCCSDQQKTANKRIEEGCRSFKAQTVTLHFT